MSKKVKRFVVIGLGSFGTVVARRLAEEKCRVVALDAESEHVEQLKNLLWEGVVGDATQRDTLELLNLAEAEAVVISLGEDITRSILATLHVLELVKRHNVQVIVKGVTAEHGMILKKLGASRVVFPETEIAKQLAEELVSPGILDKLALGENFSFIEIAVPAPFVGKTLKELELRKKYGLNVVGIREPMEAGNIDVNIGPDVELEVDQILLIIGKKEDVEKFQDWIEDNMDDT